MLPLANRNGTESCSALSRGPMASSLVRWSRVTCGVDHWVVVMDSDGRAGFGWDGRMLREVALRNSSDGSSGCLSGW